MQRYLEFSIPSTFIEKEVKSIYSLIIRNFKYLSIGPTIEQKVVFWVRLSLGLELSHR